MKKTQVKPRHIQVDDAAESAPRCARSLLTVRRDTDDFDAPMGPPEEILLSEAASQTAETGSGPPAQWELDIRLASRRREPEFIEYQRPSDRRVCLRPTADSRSEERECPTLLQAFRDAERRRPPTTSGKRIRKLTSEIFSAIDRNDFRPLLNGGWDRLFQAFASWVDAPIVMGAAEADPSDRRLRRRRAEGQRQERFGSVDEVVALSCGLVSRAHIGVSSVKLSIAMDAKRTRAQGREIPCSQTMVSAGHARGVLAVDRQLDADLALRGAVDDPRALQALADAAAGLTMDERVRRFREREAAARRAIPDEPEAHDQAVLAATKDLTDQEIRRLLIGWKARAAKHLRRMPRAVAENPAAAHDRSDLLGLIPSLPARKQRKAPPRRAAHDELTPSWAPDVL
jgi:hypothetical protein